MSPSGLETQFLANHIAISNLLKPKYINIDLLWIFVNNTYPSSAWQLNSLTYVYNGYFSFSGKTIKQGPVNHHSNILQYCSHYVRNTLLNTVYCTYHTCTLLIILLYAYYYNHSLVPIETISQWLSNKIVHFLIKAKNLLWKLLEY